MCRVLIYVLIMSEILKKKSNSPKKTAGARQCPTCPYHARPADSCRAEIPLCPSLRCQSGVASEPGSKDSR